jgi:hypothetical protein
MSSRTRRRLAAGAAVLGGLMCAAAPAQAALTSPQADAFVVSANAFGTFAAVAPTPHSTYTPGGTVTAVGLNVGPFATNATLTATTGGDPSTGNSSASATVDNLSVNLLVASLAVTGVNSTCSATPSGATGNGTIATGSVTSPLGVTLATLSANAQPNTMVNIPAIGSVVLNEQSTDGNGVLTVNAVHIKVLPTLNAADVVIGHAQCGGAPPVQPTPMVSAPIAAGTAAMAVTGGVVYLRRRNRANGVDAA